MKQILPIVALLFMLVSGASAQKTRSYATPLIKVDVQGIVGMVESFATVQSAVNGAVVHDITIRTKLNSAQQLLSTLVARGQKNGASGFAMSVRFLDHSATVTDARDYNGVTVTSIEFPELSAQSKEAVTIEIKLRAQALSTRPTGEKEVMKISTKSKVALESNYSMTRQGVPTTRVVKISSFKLVPCANFGCDSISAFEIWVPGSDGGPWLQWFSDVTANPNLSKDGTISLLTPDRKSAFVEIQLKGVVPTGYADETSPSGARAHVFLRAAQARVKFYD